MSIIVDLRTFLSGIPYGKSRRQQQTEFSFTKTLFLCRVALLIRFLNVNRIKLFSKHTHTHILNVVGLKNRDF